MKNQKPEDKQSLSSEIEGSQSKQEKECFEIADKRSQEMIKESEIKADRQKLWAMFYETTVLILYLTSLSALVLSSISGLFNLQRPLIIGIISSVGTVVTFFLHTAKCQRRALWYRKSQEYELKAIRQLKYRSPHPLTIEAVASVSKELDAKRDAHNKTWEKLLLIRDNHE